jgi:hypothetical protein
VNDAYDTPWKEALTRYFPEFMSFYFPAAYRDIDWTRPHSFLEQELSQVVRDARLGCRAHLLTQQTRGQHVKRHAAKWRLARLLYERNWDKQRVIDLFAVIDWMMWVPAEFQSQLLANISDLERTLGMPYMNPFEKRGLEQGRQEGRREGRQEGRQEGVRELLTAQLEKRFGPLSPSIRNQLSEATPETLRQWGEAIIVARRLDEVFPR